MAAISHASAQSRISWNKKFSDSDTSGLLADSFKGLSRLTTVRRSKAPRLPPSLPAQAARAWGQVLAGDADALADEWLTAVSGAVAGVMMRVRADPSFLAPAWQR